MTAWSATHPMIDELLREGEQYSITFARDLGIPAGPDNDTWTTRVYTRHGVKDTLGAMSQILVTMSKGNFDILDAESAKDELLKTIADQLKIPGQLEKVQSGIRQLTGMIDRATNKNALIIRDAIKQRARLLETENDLMSNLDRKDDTIAGAYLALEFVELVERIVAEAESGALDLEEEIGQDLLDLGGVPAGEPRKTVGAFVYYYVKRLASMPIAPNRRATDRRAKGLSPMVITPRAYVLIEPIA